MVLPRRKHMRLEGYDYSQIGAYFVTICTQHRQQILGKIYVGRDVLIPPLLVLSDYGKMTDMLIQKLPDCYNNIEIPMYVIMPNHVHLLIVLTSSEKGEKEIPHPKLQTIIRSLKTFTTREIGFSIWQDSFYEHIIRNEEHFLRILKYIEDNPGKWTEDKYYVQ